MPAALDWLATAEECFADEYGSLRQGLLTSVFSLVVGLERVFHLDEMEDAGFARLCGGRRCPSRYTVGGWRRHLPWYEVDAFCRRTCPWHLLRNAGRAGELRRAHHPALDARNSTSARATSPPATSTCAARNCSPATTWPAAVS